MVDFTQLLPAELLTEILENATVPDVLRLQRVSRVFHDIVLASPLLQHKIELYGAGFVYNAASGISVADSRRALLQYLENSRKFTTMIRKKIMVHPAEGKGKIEGGVYATIQDSVKLLSFGSISRRIPVDEWEIPLPIVDPTNFCFYPVADVIAFFKQHTINDVQTEIHIRTLSRGHHHVAAQSPIIRYSRSDAASYEIASVSVTRSRLSMFTSDHGRPGGKRLIVWDWRTAQLLLDLEEQQLHTAEFIDDYRLLVVLVSWMRSTPSSLALINTAKIVGGTPMQTIFHLSPELYDFKYPSLRLGVGAHEPSPAELLAPFHHDPSQRIVALAMQDTDHPVFRVAALLELLETHEGTEIGWDEWKNRVFMASFDLDDDTGADIWISGCLFFFGYLSPLAEAHVGVCDFSLQHCARNLREETDNRMGGVRSLADNGERGHFPWYDAEGAYGGYDCILITSRRDEDGEFVSDDGQVVLYMWSF